MAEIASPDGGTMLNSKPEFDIYIEKNNLSVTFIKTIHNKQNMGKSVLNTVRVYNSHPLPLDFDYLNECIPAILKHFHSFKHTIATR